MVRWSTCRCGGGGGVNGGVDGGGAVVDGDGDGAVVDGDSGGGGGIGGGSLLHLGHLVEYLGEPGLVPLPQHLGVLLLLLGQVVYLEDEV